MNRTWAFVLAVIMMMSLGMIGGANAEGETLSAVLTLTMDAEQTAAHSMHRGLLAECPGETTNTLTLNEDGTYIWEKTLQSTEGTEVFCKYTFRGSYEMDKKGRAVLNPAETCDFEENYGKYDGASPADLIHNRSGNEQTDPECLEYFNTAYIVYNGNAQAKVQPDLEKGTFAIRDHSDQWEYMWKGENEKHIVRWIAQQYELRPLGEIVYYGASNFRLWTNMEADMQPYAVQNHGIGGSIDLELMEFADQLLFPFEPSVVFIQTGSNDYTGGATMEECFANKEKMYAMFRERLPEAKFIVMAGLPLPGRAEYWDLTVEVNHFLKDYCETHENMYFVDGTDGILTSEGPEELATGDGRYFNPEIFIEDQIHLTQEGHDIWTQYMKAQLEALDIH